MRFVTDNDDASIDTRAVHGGRPVDHIEGAVAFPIFQSSTFGHVEGADYDAVRYSRLSNGPNHLALHAHLCSLSGAEAALSLASGMAAISHTLLSLLRPGDHVVAQAGVYGGSHMFLERDLAQLGIDVTFVDASVDGSWAAACTERTKVLYCEAISNPLCTIVPLAEIAAFAKQRGLVSIIDATFATPVNLLPMALGFDLELHSASKYMAGHSDLVAGCVMGSQALIDRLRHTANHLGGSLDPNACFLLQRGLKTLALRVRRQNDNAAAIASALHGRPGVAAVHYPGVPTPLPARMAAPFNGFGGVVSVTLEGGADAARRFIAAAKLMTHAPSLGGVETLITCPATTSHVGISPAERLRLGIADGLVRISCGIEGTADLVGDANQALESSH